jgi:hypothetical protein
MTIPAQGLEDEVLDFLQRHLPLKVFSIEVSDLDNYINIAHLAGFRFVEGWGNLIILSRM